MTLRFSRCYTFFLALATLLLVVASGGAAVSRAAAHPADMYYHTHTIIITPDGVQAVWAISPGTMLAYVLWNNADANGDGVIDDTEALAWAEPYPERYLALADGTPLEWQLVGVDWPGSLVNFEIGKEVVEIHLALDWPDSLSDTSQIAFYNQYEEYNSSNWYIVQAEEGAQFRTPLQKNGALTFQMVLNADPAADAAPTAADMEPLRTYWDSGTPAIGASGAKVETPRRREEDTSASSKLADLVRRENLSLTFYLTAFGIAVGLGSLHALTPGHGKALVGAYLVGSRGTMQHALALGGIVTMTHTGSVLALGLITLAASHILLPTTLFPILEMVSGLLVVAMGAGLIYRRYKAWRSVQQARRRTSSAEALREQLPEVPPELTCKHTPALVTQPAVSPPPATRPETRSAKIQINQPIQVNVYNDVLPQENFALGGVNWRALVALGVSGGLVPCPDAIAILLVAVTINRILLGLSLIVAFSLGLAFVLTGIGIAMVRSRRLFEGLDTLNRMIPALPLISALIVTALGLGLTYNAAAKTDFFNPQESKEDTLDFTVGNESNADSGGELLTLAEAFDINTTNILYLDTDDDNLYQVYVKPARGGSAKKLITTEFGVWDYKLSPDLTRIAYATPREFGGSEIWQVDVDGGNVRLLLTCEVATCSRLAWTPDGRQLVYEKLELTSPQSSLGVTTLWWLDVESGDSGPVFRDSQLPSYNPAWSPDGQWLSYLAPGSATVQIYNLATGENRAIPSQTGNAAVWSPDGATLLYTQIWEEGAQFFTHLMRYDIASRDSTDLTNVPQAGDTWATWSPDGEQIAVVRRIYGGAGASVGDQIWLMNADGSNARPLTDTAEVIHGIPVWSPDGRYLTFQRYPLAGSTAQPGVWMLDTQTHDLRQLAPRGNWPVWLP